MCSAARCGVKGEKGKCGDEVNPTSEVGSIRKRLQKLVHVCHRCFWTHLLNKQLNLRVLQFCSLESVLLVQCFRELRCEC